MEVPFVLLLFVVLVALIVNVVVAVSTYAAFRGQHPELMVSLRLALGFFVAVVIAHIVHRLPVGWVLNRKLQALLPSRKSAVLVAAGGGGSDVESGINIGFINEGASALVNAKEQVSIRKKIIGAIRCSAFDFLDIGFYLVIGAAITSVFNTAVSRDVIAPLAGNSVFAIGAMMVLALVLSLCSTSDAFIAANFVAFPFAAKLSFLVLGPMMDLKLLFMYQMVFRKRFTLLLALALFLFIGAICLNLHQIIPK